MVFDMPEGVDHIGIATHSLDAHSKFWTTLGIVLEGFGKSFGLMFGIVFAAGFNTL